MHAAPHPAEVTLALNLQHGRIVLDLLGQRYDDFESPYGRAEVVQALADDSPSRVALDPLVSFGSTLFSALFAGQRGPALWQQLDRATREHGALRLRIVTNVERLQHLPWELLYDASRKDFITLSGRVALVRTRPDAFVRGAQPEPTARLRVLAVTADPDGALDAAAQLDRLLALAAAHPGQLEMVALRDATVSSLTAALHGGTYDLFVFLGDGVVLDRVSKGGGEQQALQMVPEGAGDLGQFNRNRLGQLLVPAGVRLALLNGSDTEWVARSLAKYLAAAIGFRERWRPAARQVAIDALFAALLAGTPLDLAVGATRQAIDRAQPDSGDWCRLIFYLQAADGNLLLAPPPLPAGGAAVAAAGGASREQQRLVRLREIALANLDVARQRAALHPEAARGEIAALREQADALAQQLVRLGSEGG